MKRFTWSFMLTGSIGMVIMAIAKYLFPDVNNQVWEVVGLALLLVFGIGSCAWYWTLCDKEEESKQITGTGKGGVR